MSWLWIYLGGAAVWLFVTIALSVATEDPPEQVRTVKSVFLLAPIWPLGAILFAAAMFGYSLRTRK